MGFIRRHYNHLPGLNFHGFPGDGDPCFTIEDTDQGIIWSGMLAQSLPLVEGEQRDSPHLPVDYGPTNDRALLVRNHIGHLQGPSLEILSFRVYPIFMLQFVTPTYPGFTALTPQRVTIVRGLFCLAYSRRCTGTLHSTLATT